MSFHTKTFKNLNGPKRELIKQKEKAKNRDREGREQMQENEDPLKLGTCVIIHAFYSVDVPDTQGRNQDAQRRTTFRSQPS